MYISNFFTPNNLTEYSKETISSVVSNVMDKPFPDAIKCIWDTILEDILEDSPNLFNKKELVQMRTELLLLALNYFSVNRENYISGVNNFLKEAEMPSCSEDNLVYDNKNTFQKFVDHLMPYLPPENFAYINTTGISGAENGDTNTSKCPGSGKDGEPDAYTFREIKSFEQSNLIHDHTALSDYIFCNVINLSNELQNPDKNILVKDSRTKYFFNREGRYFLSVLLRSISVGNSPYTRKADYGISLDSLNTLFRKLYRAYCSCEIQCPRDRSSNERLLFLINAETIYQPSLIKELFSSLRQYFAKSRKEAVTGFLTALQNIGFMKTRCPLNSLILSMWKSNRDLLFKNLKLRT